MEKTKKVRIKKGEYGYINSEKKRQLKKTCIAFGISIAIFVLGLALNKWDKNNVFTLVAAISILPAAKILIRYILFFPYKTAEPKFHEKLADTLGSGETILEDVIFTTSEKAMGFYAVAVSEHFVFAYMSRRKDDKTKTYDLLGKAIRGWGFSHKLIVSDSEETFFKDLKKYEASEPSENVMALMEQLRVLIP